MITKYIKKLETTKIKKYKLWQICDFDRKFSGVSKEKQKNIIQFKHVSAKELKEYKLEEHGKVKLLSTGNYVGYTRYDENDKNINHGEVITIPTGGTANIKYHKGYFVDSGNILLTSSTANLKYIYYYLTKINEIIQGFFRGAGVQHPSMPDIIELDIPIPPMEVQNEIVEVLDKFSALEAELEAELEARIKQYEYYRDDLLNQSNSKKMKLKEVLKIKNGKDYKKYGKGNYPVYGTGGIMTHIDHYAYDKPSVLIPRKGSLDKLYYLEKPFWTVDTLFYTEINDCIAVPKFIYYYLEKERLEQYNTAGGVPSLTQTILNEIEILIPSLHEQEHIVSILDKFSTLITDIKEGLPAEIELRRKQYEYYRNKLLTFDKE
jgi:type I restriction enzyme S subunit